MNKKSILAWFVIFVLSIGLLSGCANVGTVKNDKYSVVCTIFPEYDWVKEILGDNIDEFELTLLLDNGVDLHSYQPTAEDILKISTCDLFIYVGGESDEWVRDALRESVNKDMQVISLLDVLGDAVKEEEMIEGMEAEEKHEHGNEGDDDEIESHNSEALDKHDGHGEEIEYDEHVWLSLKNAKSLINAISLAIQNIDSENRNLYENNTDSYISKLDVIDKEYESMVSNASKDTVIFGDRFPFRYMIDDYSLKYYAAFVGCSAETEASFETIVFLAGKSDELKLDNIIVTESSDKKLAQTIISNTNGKNKNILVMDSMQSTTSKDINAGETYISIMKKNLETLKTALD